MTVHVNIGSNTGDRHAQIERAVAAIELRFAAPVRRSAIIESEPWGYDSPNPYLNIGLMFESELPPEQLVGELLDIQRAIDPAPHRNPDGTYADRAIDIDLIAVGNMVVTSSQLALPHPRMHLRRFVLLPMLELDPDWVHPLLHLTPRQLLNKISTTQ